MSDGKKDWAAIIKNANTNTKVIALIALVAEALFLSSLPYLRDQYLLYALFTCAGILIVSIYGIVELQKSEDRAKEIKVTNLVPSPLTPDSKFLNEFINSAIQTVCRAVSLPQTPQNAKLRVFIFRKETDQLVCTHYWSQDPVTEQVGKLKFQLTIEVAKKVAIVRAVLDDKICRTAVESLPSDIEGINGDVDDNLKYVLAAPIKNKDNSVWGTVDFDTASDIGKAMLSTEVSNAVMFQLARHLSVIFSI